MRSNQRKVIWIQLKSRKSQNIKENINLWQTYKFKEGLKVCGIHFQSRKGRYHTPSKRPGHDQERWPRVPHPGLEGEPLPRVGVQAVEEGVSGSPGDPASRNASHAALKPHRRAAGIRTETKELATRQRQVKAWILMKQETDRDTRCPSAPGCLLSLSH